jgi:hypothetical protein
MIAPRLLIRKAMSSASGRPRPLIQIQADIDPAMMAKLTELCSTENLFKRTSYSNGFPAGVVPCTPPLQPHLGSLLKNDACPEITVKTMLAGQIYQAQGMWDLMAFEYIAQRAFDSLCALMLSASEIGTETVYRPADSDLVAFAADMVSDMSPVPVTIAVSPPEGLADAA